MNKEYIALIYGDDGQIYRCDKPYPTRVQAMKYLLSKRMKGSAQTFILFDGFVYDWIMLRVEVSTWLASLKFEQDVVTILTEATIKNVQNMLTMQ